MSMSFFGAHELMVSNARFREERGNRRAVVKIGTEVSIVLDDGTLMVIDDGEIVKDKIG